MQRTCDACGTSYQAKRPQSRFCSDTCRKRNQRAPSTPAPADEKAPTPTGLAAATEKQLREVERFDSVLGQQALALARRIDSPHETGASVASLSKELRAVMVEALDGVSIAADPLDELRRKRDERRAAAG